MTDTSAVLFVSSNAIKAGTAGTNTLAFAGVEPIITVDSGTTGTISDIVTGTAGLTKTGPGTLALSGANTYTGTTTIGGGVVSANSLSASSASLGNATTAITLASGGRCPTRVPRPLPSRIFDRDRRRDDSGHGRHGHGTDAYRWHQRRQSADPGRQYRQYHGHDDCHQRGWRGGQNRHWYPNHGGIEHLYRRLDRKSRHGCRHDQCERLWPQYRCSHAGQHFWQ